MPSKNFTIDNVNPLIDYQPVGTWSEGNSTDGLMSSYSDSTFTLCISSGATATFTFNGTAVYLFGAKRGNHGLYNVTLDGTTTGGNGQYPDPGLFRTPLFAAANLENTLHTVTLTNAGITGDRAFDYLDLDFITWTADYGTDSEKATESTIQDTSTQFSYSPASAWNTNPADLSNFFGQSGHATTTSGAYTTLTFVGDAVQIFGTVGPQVSPYSVQLDNGSSTTHNATKYAAYQQVLIYYADNLGSGTHEVKITNTPALSGESLNINYALVDTVPSVTATSANSKSGLGGGAIAGIVIGVLALLAIVGIAFFLFRRRRQSQEAIAYEKPLIFEPLPHPDVTPAPVPERVTSFEYPSSFEPASSPSASSPPTSSSGQGYQGRSVALGGVHNPDRGMTQQSPAQAFAPVARPLPRPNKAQMAAQERPQDAGHVPVDGDMPPPDYSQATGPSQNSA